MPRPLKCFIFMPFDNAFRPICEAARVAIERSKVVEGIRADDIFRPGNVVDQLTAAICEADFCIADTTDNNPNVMWEIGYARALRKPVIIVRQHTTDSIPFDIRIDRTFTYQRENLAELTGTLIKTIRDVVSDLGTAQSYLGWRYDELTNLKNRLCRCMPTRSSCDLVTILRRAVKRIGRVQWEPMDVLKLMEGIRGDTTASEHQNSFGRNSHPSRAS